MSFLLGQRSFQLTFSRFVLFRFFTLRNFFVTMTLFVCLHHESSAIQMIHKNGCLSDRSLFMACVVYVGFYDHLPTITNCPGVSGYFTRWLWGSPRRLYSVPVNRCHPRTHTSIIKTKHHFQRQLRRQKAFDHQVVNPFCAHDLSEQPICTRSGSRHQTTWLKTWLKHETQFVTLRANNCQVESQGLMSTDLSIGLSA